jgi:GPI mannosyltransferase 3
VSPPYWYLREFGVFWGWAYAPLGLLALWGARRDPLPLFVAIVIVLSHSAIDHKEYRFIYPAIPLLLFSASQGSAELCAWLASQRGSFEIRIAAIVGLAWLVTSGALAVSDPMRPLWSRALGGLELMSRTGTEARCGVAVLKIAWFWTGGYTSLHEPIPIHQLLSRGSAAWDINAFDAWIVPESANEPRAAGFTLSRCLSKICLWTRKGPCHRERWTEVQTLIEARGQ